MPTGAPRRVNSSGPESSGPGRLDEHVTDIRTRVDLPALLADLTLEEKAALLDGSDFWHTQGNERLGIPAIMLTDGAHGLRKQATSAENLTLTTSVPATCFPPAVGLASSWDPALLRPSEAVMLREADLHLPRTGWGPERELG